ncbi:VOC family protein [Microlunatus sp. GCM10028923]|uniref:VOC family protein n=1 Tax=Microlunatus sp. GCM10028923 TaxID=3273400 RepID=UPI00361C09E0
MNFTKLTPYLRYPDGDAAVAWLTRVLGFGPARCARDENGAWYEGDLAVGDSKIAISGGGTAGNAYLIISVPDADAQYRKIIEAGVEIDEPQDKPYGPRTVTVTDPWGNVWDFWQGEAEF